MHTSTVLRAASNFVLESEKGAKVSYTKGDIIDFRVDESGTPFVMSMSKPDMSGSSQSIVSTVPYPGHVKTSDDMSPYVRVTAGDPAMTTSARDALSSAGISVLEKPEDPGALYVKREVVGAAKAVLTGMNITTTMAEMGIPQLRSSALVFASSELFETLLKNTMFESELKEGTTLRSVSLKAALVSENVSHVMLTAYMAESEGSFDKAKGEVKLPVRSLGTTLTLENKYMAAKALTAAFQPSKDTIVESVSKIHVEQDSHIDKTGFYVQKSFLLPASSVTESVRRVKSFLAESLGSKVRIVTEGSDGLRLRTLDNVTGTQLAETCKSFNRTAGLDLQLQKEEDTSDTYLLYPLARVVTPAGTFYGESADFVTTLFAESTTDVETTTEE